MVMCSDPVTRTPLSGWPGAYFFRMDISPGISCSAIEISLRPHSASPRSATLYSVARLLTVAVLIGLLVGYIQESRYVDIIQDDPDGVNPEEPEAALRSQPRAHSRAG